MGAIERRLEEWKRRLLDLGRRNPLLYFGRSRSTRIQVLAPGGEALVGLLTEGRSLTFPQVIKGDLFDILATTDGEPDQSAVRPGDLETDQPAKDLQRKLDRLRARAREAIEEQGINVLYVAIGFLEWRESDASTEVVKSPLVLIPVSIKYERGRPFRLEMLDEEITDNPALKYRLESDFDIALPDLPDWGEEGRTSLEDYIASIAVLAAQRGWRVLPEVWLSVFSFESLVLYRDIHDNPEIYAAHDVLRWLAGEEQQADRVDPHFGNLDDDAPAASVFPVLDADDSQLEVLLRARAGQHLVVHGPPGTGKSQTIANLIAQSMRDGKRVLFVSRKMAALEVVHDRLEEAGLGDLCLELHSHRSNKKEVIQRLNASLERGRHRSRQSGDFARLQELRENLNEFAARVRAPLDSRGRSPRDMYVEGAGLRGAPRVKSPLSGEQVFELGVAAERALFDAVAAVSDLAPIYDLRRTNPWRGTALRHVSQDDILNIGDALRVMSQSLEHARRSWSALRRLCEVEHARSVSELPAKQLIVDHLARATPLSGGLVRLRNADLPGLKSELDRGASLEKRLEEARILYRARFHDTILGLDAEEVGGLRARFASEFYASWLKSFSRRYRADAKLLRPHLLASLGARRDYAQMRDGIAAVSDFIAARNELDKLCESLDGVIGELLQDRFETKWAPILEGFDWYRRYLELTGFDVCPTPDVLTDSAHVLSEEASRIAPSLRDATESIQEALELLTAIFPDGFDSEPLERIPWETLADLVKMWASALPELDDWCALARALDSCAELGLGPFLEDATTREVRASELPRALRRSLNAAWIAEMERRLPDLAGSPRSRIDGLREEFRSLDRELRTAAAELTLDVATASRPSTYGSASARSEVGILRRQAQLTRPRRPLRQLLPSLPTLLPALKPCLLMSPLSVATYLPIDQPPVDLVIFDEASQIPPEEAVSAVVRGRQVIVAGDEKQLPPTSFFQAVAALDEEEGDDEPLTDSILEECIPIFPEAYLDWHYRSRHESLIAFSNHEFYDGRLITFPSAIDNDHELGVKFVWLEEGTFDRGGSKTNRAEARYVAEMVMSHFTHRPDRSLGVIAMSISQQEAIERELFRLRQEHPDLDDLFAEERPEHFFVKNLERVQGDERDRIIISLGYGPDTRGVVNMQFGPLSRSGGQRRLNVAATRGKEMTTLVSSLRPSQLDLSRLTTGSASVALLQRYIEYAQSGGVLPLANAQSVGLPESPFEEQVKASLEREGFGVECQVGVSAFRIDLAVKHPDRPGRYILGIECDGATYHRALSARMRDRLRQDVLEGLGWTITRIWSADWFRNPEGVTARIVEEVSRLRSVSSEGIRSDR